MTVVLRELQGRRLRCVTATGGRAHTVDHAVAQEVRLRSMRSPPWSGRPPLGSPLCGAGPRARASVDCGVVTDTIGRHGPAKGIRRGVERWGMSCPATSSAPFPAGLVRAQGSGEPACVSRETWICRRSRAESTVRTAVLRVAGKATPEYGGFSPGWTATGTRDRGSRALRLAGADTAGAPVVCSEVVTDVRVSATSG